MKLFIAIFTTLLIGTFAAEVRLVDLEPSDAQQLIDQQDTSLKYAPKVDSNVPAVRFLGNEPHNVREDIYLANQYHGQDGLGGYLYGYGVPDIAKTERKKAGGDLRGAYNYISGDGQEIKVEYWDDGTGFHQIDNVPKILPKDNEEVAAAKAEFQRIWEQEAERNSKPIASPYDSEGKYLQGVGPQKQHVPQGGSQYGPTPQYPSYNQYARQAIPSQGQTQYQQPSPQYQQQGSQNQPQYQQVQGQYKPQISQPQGQYNPQQGQPQGNQGQYSQQASVQPQLQPIQPQGQPQGAQNQLQGSQGQYSQQNPIQTSAPQPHPGQNVQYYRDHQFQGQQSQNVNQYQPQSQGQGQAAPVQGQHQARALNPQTSLESGQYGSHQGDGEDSGEYDPKKYESEEPQGPPKGFFYSFDYPVGIIVKEEGLVKRESNVADVYDANKAVFEKQLRGEARPARSSNGYLYVKN